MSNDNKEKKETDNKKQLNAKNSTEEKLELLDNQIHNINIKLHEPDSKSWLSKNASLLISILALVTSVIFTIYGIYRDTSKEKESSKSKKIAEVEQLIFELAEIEEKTLDLINNGSGNTDINAQGTLINYKRQIKIDKLTGITDSLNHKFPPYFYSLVGTILRNDSQFEKAIKYYHKELSVAVDPADQTVAYRDLGSVYGIKSTSIYNPDSAVFFRKKSTIVADNIDGPIKYDIKGYSYELWALDELSNNNETSGKSLIDSARNVYLKMPESQLGLRQFRLNRLSQIISAYDNKSSSNVYSTLTGRWQTSKNSDPKASVAFYFNNGWYVNIEFYSNDKIIYKCTGQMLYGKGRKLYFNIQGVGAENVNFKPVQLMGSAEVTSYPNNPKALNIKINTLSNETNESKSILVYKL